MRPRASLGRAALLVSLAALVCGALACDRRREGFGEPARSVEDVAERAVSALSRGDRKALIGLLVRQAEYRRLVFPALPASAPEGNLDPDFAWENMQLRSLRDLGRAEREWQERGRPALRLVSVKAEGIEQHGGLRIHGPLRVTIRAGDGPEEALRLLGGVVERDGQFKLLAYRR
jgi:hypothetical protein